jgi:predicted amidohydrolase YtcJ
MKTIRIPVLHDHHSHPLFYAAFATGVSLGQVASKVEANDLLVAASKDHQGITVAHGWRSNRFDWSNDELESLPPVAIFNVSLHSLLMNDAGRQQLRQHYGDDVQRLDDRVWYESNLRVVLNWFANLNASAEALRAFFNELSRLGVHSAEELLLVDEREIELFEEASLTDRTRFWAAPDTFASLSADAKDQVHGLKLFTDGAIGARTAAMKRPYLDDKNNLGMLIYSDEELLQTVSQCLATKRALAIHAIGDRAIEQVILSLEQIDDERRGNKEIRIEHAQMLDLDLARRAKAMGVCLSMQPNFTSDSVDYGDRLDVRYCHENNPFRMLIDELGFVAGKDLIFGSDGMPHGVEFALQQSLFPAFDQQRLTLDEFVAGYCVTDESKGTIEVSIDEKKRTVNMD